MKAFRFNKRKNWRLGLQWLYLKPVQFGGKTKVEQKLKETMEKIDVVIQWAEAVEQRANSADNEVI